MVLPNIFMAYDLGRAVLQASAAFIYFSGWGGWVGGVQFTHPAP